ncbi:unnamed protein product, partial [Scytosiphon promiscuus]
GCRRFAARYTPEALCTLSSLYCWSPVTHRLRRGLEDGRVVVFPVGEALRIVQAGGLLITTCEKVRAPFLCRRGLSYRLSACSAVAMLHVFTLVPSYWTSHALRLQGGVALVFWRGFTIKRHSRCAGHFENLSPWPKGFHFVALEENSGNLERLDFASLTTMHSSTEVGTFSRSPCTLRRRYPSPC